MNLLKSMCVALLASGLMAGQSSGPSSAPASGPDKVSEQIKALQIAIAEQQEQIARLQRELEQNKSAAPQVVNASLNSSGVNTPAVQSDAETQKRESPLSFRIGGTDWTPGGFMDFNNIFRTVNTGNVVSTGFGGIPFNNTPAGQLTEYRSTGQYSRWNLKVGGKYGATNLTGFLEGDFNGNDAANVFVTTNPHTLRLRLYYLNARRGIWEFTAGQAWSLITPNRVGVGPMGGDLSTTASTDGNIHVGVPHGRDGQFRIAVRPNDNFSWAFSVENPQQITNGEVVLPSALAGQLATQVDGVATAGVPNAFPDLITKLAWDSKLRGRAFHVEAGGLLTSAKVAVLPTGAPAGTAFSKHSKIGSGGLAGINLELIRNFRVLAYGVYGGGVGRYFNGLGPQFVVAPVNAAGAVCSNTGGCDVELSMVKSGSGFGGIEWQAASKTNISAYYGGQFYTRNAFPDITSAAATKPIIGFGGAGSAGNNNRAIQEGSLVWTQTLWKNPQFGALLFINDASYSTRAPWFVNKNATTGALLAPKNAHMFMDHVVLRYVLP